MKNNESIFHYTRIHGLDGILQSQTIRASHYKQLNDKSEYFHGLSVLKHLIYEIVREKKLLSKIKSSLSKENENSEDILVARLINTLYSTLNDTTLGIFITSFCQHTPNTYEYDNGLLSMWRAYGGDGGYAIEIDKHEFYKLIKEMQEKFSFQGVLSDVEYVSSTSKNLKEELGSFYQEFKDSCSTFIERSLLKDVKLSIKDAESSNIAVGCINTFLGGCIIKHPAFKEELETRNIIIPSRVTEESKCFFKDMGAQEREQMPVLSHPKEGRIVPFIEMKSINSKPLPIKRIIVGPHKDQKRRVDGLQYFADKFGFQVATSQTPYAE